MYQNPRHVFEGMLKNNFSTTGFTRQVSSKQNGVEAQELAKLQLGNDTFTRTLTTLKQGSDTVTTDAISTPSQDYVRYVSIDTKRKNNNGKSLNFASAVGVWAKTDSQTPGSSQSITQMMLGIFPMANLSPQNRHDLLQQMDRDNVFSVNYDKVKKQTIDGRRVYTYEVQLMPQAYVAMLKSFGQYAGVGDQVMNLNPDDYQGQKPTTLIVSVDAMSHHLLSVDTKGVQGYTQEFSSYGVNRPLQLPKNTITSAELQQRLSTQ